MATAMSSRCCGWAWRRRRRQGMEMWVRGITGERWGMSWRTAARRRLTKCADGDMWPPHGVQVLNQSDTIVAIQFGLQSEWTSLTTCFADVQTPKPWSISANNLNQSCSPIYHLQYLFKDQSLILNEQGVKSSQSQLSKIVNAKWLRKISKCWKLCFSDFCELKKTKLCTELAHDPKIKVVALLKYYNFA